MWRTGGKVSVNIYDDNDNIVGQCQNVEYAKRIVEAINKVKEGEFRNRTGWSGLANIYKILTGGVECEEHVAMGLATSAANNIVANLKTTIEKLRILRKVAIRIIDNAKSTAKDGEAFAVIPLTLFAELEDATESSEEWARRLVKRNIIGGSIKEERLTELEKFHDYVMKYFPHTYKTTVVNLKSYEYANKFASPSPEGKVSQNPPPNPVPPATSNQPPTANPISVPPSTDEGPPDVHEGRIVCAVQDCWNDAQFRFCNIWICNSHREEILICRK